MKFSDDWKPNTVTLQKNKRGGEICYLAACRPRPGSNRRLYRARQPPPGHHFYRGVAQPMRQGSGLTQSQPLPARSRRSHPVERLWKLCGLLSGCSKWIVHRASQRNGRRKQVSTRIAVMNQKNAVQVTEITEITERMRVSHILHVHLMGEKVINDNPLLFSVFSVFSVAKCFSMMNAMSNGFH